MNIEFERTIDDLIEFNLFHVSNSSSIKKQVFAMQLLLGMLVLLLLLGLPYLKGENISIFQIIFSLFASVLIFLFAPYLNSKLTIITTKKMYREGNNQAMLGHQVIFLSDGGILGKNQSGESKINWSALGKVEQNKKYYFLYIGSVNAIVIPKRCFQSQQEENAFLDYINTHRKF